MIIVLNMFSFDRNVLEGYFYFLKENNDNILTTFCKIYNNFTMFWCLFIGKWRHVLINKVKVPNVIQKY